MAELSVQDHLQTAIGYEDYVAAHFRASGYFVEQNIEDSILELDVVATRFDPDSRRRYIVEVKSKGFHFSDAFKLLGWKTFLSETSALFIAKEGDAVMTEAYRERMDGLGVQIIIEGQATSLGDALGALGVGSLCSVEAALNWVWASLLERRLNDRMVKAAKTMQCRAGGQFLQSYYRDLCHRLYFVPSPERRARRLYELYMTCPRLAGSLARADTTGEFDSSKASTLPEGPLKTGGDYHLQGALALQHRARISTMAAAVEEALQGTLLTDGQVVSWDELVAPLPSTFFSGVSRLREQEEFYSYPQIWQAFIWLFGGFILQAKEDEELARLAAWSGTSTPVVTEALKAMDSLFPIESGSWFTTFNGVNALKLVPVSVRGLGCFLRSVVYKLEDYEAISTSDNARSMFDSWHVAGLECALPS